MFRISDLSNYMRVKRGTVSRRKHNKVLDLTKGYRGSRSRLVRTAKTAALQAGQYAYHGRKLRKRNIRTLWVTRISEAVKSEGISYSAFIHQMKDAQIELDRKMLTELLASDPETFREIVKTVNTAN